MSSSPFHCIPLLNLIINFYSTSLKQTIKAASINHHSRRAVQDYCDCTWKRLTNNNNNVKNDSKNILLQKQFIDCCRQKNFSWIVRNLLRGGGDLININLGVEAYAVNYGDNPTPLIAACISSNLETVKVLLSFPNFLVDDHKHKHHHAEFTSEMMMVMKSSSCGSGDFLESVENNTTNSYENSPAITEQTTTTMNLEPVDVNKCSANGMSPLLAVCSNNRSLDEKSRLDSAEIVRLLLESGANMMLIMANNNNDTSESENNTTHNSSKTTTSHPLVMACLLGKEDVVRIILEFFNKEQKNDDNLENLLAVKDPVMGGMTPLKAAGSRFPKIVEMLKSAGAKE